MSQTHFSLGPVALKSRWSSGSYTTVDRIYSHDNGSGSGGCMCWSDADYTTFTNNVFVSTEIYPWSIAAHANKGDVIDHNTFADGGSIRFEVRNGVALSGNLVRDNVFAGGGWISSDGSNWGTHDHNFNSGLVGTGELTGTRSSSAAVSHQATRDIVSPPARRVRVPLRTARTLTSTDLRGSAARPFLRGFAESLVCPGAQRTEPLLLPEDPPHPLVRETRPPTPSRVPVAPEHEQRQGLAADPEERACQQIRGSVAHVVGGLALVEPDAATAVAPAEGPMVPEGQVEESLSTPTLQPRLERVDLIPPLPRLERHHVA
jgi:hypothetical protein